jgi:hypothetical protein
VKRLFLMTLVIALAGALSIPANAAQKKATFGATATDHGNCTVTAAGSWSGVRVHQVSLTLTTDNTVYGPATVNVGKRKNSSASSGTLSVTFTVSSLDTTGHAHADFYSPKLTNVGSADSATISIACVP